MSVKHVKAPGDLSADPHSPDVAKSEIRLMIKDCSKTIDYPTKNRDQGILEQHGSLPASFARTEVSTFPAGPNDKPRRGLWDRDAVEMFLGDDWQNIRHYREYETLRPATGSISP